jgi:hypothetical protein
MRGREKNACVIDGRTERAVMWGPSELVHGVPRVGFCLERFSSGHHGFRAGGLPAFFKHANSFERDLTRKVA